MATGESVRLLVRPLLKATAKDYVRRSRARLVVAPRLKRLGPPRQYPGVSYPTSLALSSKGSRRAAASAAPLVPAST